jgi:pimeloyl-ACP methyl ester carboxylesterase
MPTMNLGGVSLYYEMAGAGGAPVVLVHGSWGDHTNWAAVVPEFSKRFRVVAYDRRGHSRSDRPPGQGSVHEDVDDLAALIEQLGLAPAHIVGNSFGAVIVLRLACRRPELFRTLTVHEPPIIGLLHGDPRLEAIAREVQARVGGIAEQLAAGDVAGGTHRFVEEIAFGPGAWAELPEEDRQIFLGNALSWLDETRDPDAFQLDLREVASFSAPTLLTQGDQSAPFFPAIMDILAAALPRARRFTFAGSGHVPHVTHPAAYLAALEAFLT